ncbi:MAG: tRNA (adenosine(37)-N6)-threonylcarbamoyltransferase complex ATPase subunit type 1 TsaE [Bacteroidales bacterium]|jgi:tRNA threonylcarbamoyladenosine biosynthesis protein TsaE|nr:tRNA (adenosine(37)-N6)-threonylcarbamoyltransferase complex ATPase subunit type 1 TsaE [Bacteroidales bacterium]MBP5703857.1 tRNA (adenosine(37)-N6)-threonylcarbamoyltransferase complex ATPase subunit type 1 TsaE [Paludibacteraceae bacterium]
MKTEFEYTLDEIESAASEIIKAFDGRKIVRFIGEMGAGKTTMIKSLCKLLGVDEEVTSPTFAIVNEYEGAGCRVFHFDFYRVKNQQEAIDLGLADYFYSGEYVFMEWPQLVDDFMPDDVVTLTIKEIDPTKRHATVEFA